MQAQFRILQALNQFRNHQGQGAHVAARPLAMQFTRQLRRDFASIGLQGEQRTAAMAMAASEDALPVSEKPTFFGETDVTLINNSLWGLAALSRVSDLDFDRTTPMERHRVNALSAMIWRGVRANIRHRMPADFL